MFYSQIAIDSNIDNLSEVEKFIDEIMDKYNIDKQYYGVFSVPLIESARNAIVHGNKNDIHKKVTICVQIKNKGLQCSVSDQGNGFDFESLMNKPIEQHSTNGFLKIKSLCENISFDNNGATISYMQNIPVVQQRKSRTKLLQRENNTIVKTKILQK